MSKVIDLQLDLPQTEEQVIESMKLWTLGRKEKGLSNYRNIFGPAKTRALGFTLEELERMADELLAQEFEDIVRQRAKKVVVPLTRFVKVLDEAGVEWCTTFAGSNKATAEVVSRFPKKFIGQAMVNPHEGMKAVKELEEAVKELGLGCYYAVPLRTGLPPNDKKFYPLYSKSVELGIPVFIYTTMNYSTALPMDLAHPRYLDEVARDFPEMKIVAGCGGWPWIADMVGVARRNQNVYISFEAHRPKHLATPGAGWEMLMQFGNTLLQDKVVFASGWGSYSAYSKDVIKNIIQEVRDLPLKEEVKEKWLYKNAARLFEKN
jgi:predicted TIM-barrel fold metal-dependent hydrolase